MAKLTKIELDVVRLLANGLTHKEIAKEVHRSIDGVNDITKRVRFKLQRHNSAGVVGAAYQLGLLKPGT